MVTKHAASTAIALALLLSASVLAGDKDTAFREALDRLSILSKEEAIRDGKARIEEAAKKLRDSKDDKSMRAALQELEQAVHVMKAFVRVLEPDIKKQGRKEAPDADRLEGRGEISAPKNLRGLAVDTDVKKALVGQLRPGQEAIVGVEAAPRRFFRGKIHTILQTPGRTEGTLKVVVELLDPDERLAPGMSALVLFQLWPVLQDAERRLKPKGNGGLEDAERRIPRMPGGLQDAERRMPPGTGGLQDAEGRLMPKGNGGVAEPFQKKKKAILKETPFEPVREIPFESVQKPVLKEIPFEPVRKPVPLKPINPKENSSKLPDSELRIMAWYSKLSDSQVIAIKAWYQR